ncbi:hypothetical protein TsocGM_17570 [Tautonia sociabilis]|uniref:Uncharacterized protein n=1 Tax=Tautonia sociabilis TaxID=2080755 RepID=A0A432MGT2_9BACT|nr:hypothetical protein TsocGM_17570 [Tautonia sociabilis]
MDRRFRVAGLASALLVAALADRMADAAEPIRVETPMPPPEWGLLERALLRANEDAVEQFFDRYFDDRGFALCVERWGGDDGPDDASESFGDWPLLHALGASDRVLALEKLAWEGHLRQFSLARTTEVPLGRDGMYYREFPTQFDWLHHTEGLRPFFLQGLSDPNDPDLIRRSLRFAGFYTGEDPTAPNYDPEHKVIRSLLNGSRGPLLRPATALDWAGDPIEVEGRFALRHGERSYEEMLAHFKDYTNIIGDHPQNLASTSLGLNAFALSGEQRYRDWVLEYVDAWVDRMAANGGIIPSNVGLDGTIGGGDGGRWYGGVYGWAFSVEVPQTGAIAHRNTHALGLVGFGNALLLSGDRRYVDAWRGMIEAMEAQRRVIDGVAMYPTMHGDDGWYAFVPNPYRSGALEVYYWSMDPADRDRVPGSGWLDYLDGLSPDYPCSALRADLDAVRRAVQEIADDPTTPDTRLSDDVLARDPVAIGSLTELMLGGLPTGNNRPILHARLRYFDPERRRAGLPPDVAALVDAMTADSVSVTLVNLDPTRDHTVSIQGGAFGEHRLRSIRIGEETTPVDGRTATVRLSPGCGARLEIAMDRYAGPPTLRFPWDLP